VLGWRSRVAGWQRSLLRRPVAIAVMDVMRTYDRGGGGMLAASLAYFAFFSVVPALLLFVSLLGILIENRALRDELVEALISQLDPLSEVATVVVDGLADSGRTGTILGLLGLIWGASGFYGALQGAMLRMFPGPGQRDLLRTRLRGVVTVVLILGSMLVAVVVIVLVPSLTAWLSARCRELDGMLPGLLAQACQLDVGAAGSAVAVVASMAIAFLASLVVYTVVPPDGASMAQAFWPAVVVGVAIGLFTSLFAWVAPLLVRQWQTLGIVGDVFIALVWFRLVFEALVYGAAFARLRRDRDRLRSGLATI